MVGAVSHSQFQETELGKYISSLCRITATGLMDEVLKYIFEYLVMGQLKFGMENRFIILLKCNHNIVHNTISPTVRSLPHLPPPSRSLHNIFLCYSKPMFVDRNFWNLSVFCFSQLVVCLFDLSIGLYL